MSKVNKIFVVFLLIAGVLCLAIGTAFAVDLMAEHPEEFACDLNRPVVAANRPFVDPVVDPLNQWEFPPFVFPLDSAEFIGKYVFDLSLPAYSFAKDGLFEFDGIQYDWTFSQYFRFVFTVLELDVYLIDDLSSPLQSFNVSDWNSVTFEFGQDSVGVVYLRLFGVTSAFVNETLFVGELGQVYLFDFKPSTSVQQVSYRYVPTGSTSDSSLLLWHPTSVISSSSFELINHYYNFSVFYPYVPPLSGSVIVENIVDILVSGLTGIGRVMGVAFSTLAEAIFIAGSGLSTFGILVVVFAAVSLGLSLTRWVLNFCGSWGKRNR